jgi:outer membrane protein OmpA-like peptidoglycan-associated protein
MKILLTAIMTIVGSVAFAATPTVSIVKLKSFQAAENPSGWWIFAGGNAGVINSDIQDGLSNGSIAGFRGQMALYAEEYVLGFGANVDSIALDAVKNRFSALSLEASARYRLPQRFSVGPEILAFVNQGEKFGDNNYITPYLGASVYKDVPYEQNIVRVGAKVLTDVTVSEETQTHFQLLAEMGWGSSNREASKPVAEVRRSYTQEELKVAELKFDSASAVLSIEEKQKLKNLAKVLQQNKDLFKSVRLVGHADKRPFSRSNLKLSKDRASSVAQALKLNTELIEGVGTAYPISNSDLSKNRRVEIMAKDISDVEALKKALQSIQ